MERITTVGDLRKALEVCDDNESIVFESPGLIGLKTVEVTGIYSSGGGRITVIALGKWLGGTIRGRT